MVTINPTSWNPRQLGGAHLLDLIVDADLVLLR